MIRKQFLLNQNSYKKLVFLVLFNLTSFLFYGQVITGTVVDQSNETLIGASVVLKGTTIGTATDFDGNFTLDISKSQVRTLVVSFTGYKTKEVSIGNQKNFIVSLAEDVSTLGEVVVVAIGYGNKKITDLTGSIASVSTKDFQKAPVTNVEGLIANKLPGVQITPTSGKPGAGGSILIRGGSSLSATNDPLIVIDGVPVENSKSGPGILSQLNPNDIESFTVLKDASASAIYGSRASNGVVIITTKKGSSNKFDFSVSSNIRISSVIRKADVLSADQYREVVKQLGTSSTRLGNASTDWQDEIFQQAIAKEHNVSASGSVMSVLPYRASVGFLDQDGVLKTGNYKRVTALLNLSPKFFDDHLKVNVNLKGSFEGEREANEKAIRNATIFDPTQSVFMEDQTYGGYFQYVQFANNPGLAVTNPVSMLKQAKKINQSFRSIGNIQLDYKMHFLPDLHLNVNAGYDVSRSISRNAVDFNYFENDAAGGFIAYKNPDKEVKNLLFESYLFYSKELKSIKSKFDITAGYSFNDFLTTNFSYPSYFANGAINVNSYPPFPFDKPSNAIVSFYGRLNYTINEKYLLTASLRRDGSSRFSKENRWGNFPSVALAWKMK
ncbi:MAG TPA: SusC/RagA family protein, partial [Flavobacterium sp.]|nr:SusC/RagA family protein [Flavobacterium sp.]